MKHFLLAFLLIIPIALFCQTERDPLVTFTGNFTGNYDGYTKVIMYSQGKTLDSAAILNGKFTFRFPYSKTVTPLFYAKYEGTDKQVGYTPYMLLLDEPCDLVLNDIDISKGLQSGQLTGCNTPVLYHKLMLDQRKVSLKVNEIARELREKADTESEAKTFSYGGAKYDSIADLYYTDFFHHTVKTYPDEYASTYILSTQGKANLSIEQLEKFYNLLSVKRRESEQGKTIHDYITAVKSSAIGKIVQDFSLPNPDGKEISLSSLNGKYVLLDFWASWCGPCRKAFPHMREMYSNYKGDKFEILGISTDRNRPDWIKALEQEKNPWLQVHDTKGVASKLFAVQAIPTLFLIDPQGVIIIKEVGFRENGSIDKKLKELFDNPNAE